MNQFDHGGRRPERLLKISRIGNDELFNVHDIGDEKKIDEKKADKNPIQLALLERDRVVIHVYL